MTAKNVYVDLDDVLCNAARHFLVIVEREFGKRVAYEQLTDFDVGMACGLKSDERDELYRIVHRPDELLSMAPIDSAIAALNSWARLGYEISIVTGRPPESADVSIAWLHKHRIPFNSFTVVDKYSRFPPGTGGAISLAELSARRFCLAVEDSLPMAQYLAGAMKLPVALIDRPWNQFSGEPERISRYRNWEALAAALPVGTEITGR